MWMFKPLDGRHSSPSTRSSTVHRRFVLLFLTCLGYVWNEGAQQSATWRYSVDGWAQSKHSFESQDLPSSLFRYAHSAASPSSQFCVATTFPV